MKDFKRKATCCKEDEEIEGKNYGKTTIYWQAIQCQGKRNRGGDYR